tara:strand:- start:238 stop:450 length:213 start_codon:yes stop_codon:yes gene_type:complete
MCIICVQLSQDKLTPAEARRNFGEMAEVIEDDHRIEVLQAIWKKEDEEQDDSFWEDNWLADENWNGWGSD